MSHPDTRRPAAAAGIDELAPLLREHLAARTDEMAALLQRAVGIESGSDDPGGLDRMADLLEELFAARGSVERHRTGAGDTSHLVVTVAGREPEGAHLLVLGHYDTVWPAGTLATMPVRVDARNRLWGPGSFDMKGGLVQLHFALEALHTIGVVPPRPIKILLNCDEEVRSRTSRWLIESLATNAAAALVLESPLPGGALKTARKGAGIYDIAIEGVAAHAGIEPGKGASALLELSHQIQALHDLNDGAAGTSVNVGVASGGSRPNVVAAHAQAQVDVRVTTTHEAERTDRRIQGLRPSLERTRITVTPDLSRPPMEATPESRALFERARYVAALVGIPDLGEGGTGGASDANLVAALGVPTLDGFGPEGDGAHADHEHVLIDSMPSRSALIAGLLADG